MNVLFNTINKLESLLVEVPQKLDQFTESDLSHKPSPDKWSKKEILGHLCDSAFNNLGRFIRGQFEPEPFALTRYEQDDWVRVNRYQDMKIGEVVSFWISINKRINFVMSKIPEDKLAVEVEYNGASYAEPWGNKTLLWLFEDYLAHMEYHLNQIFGNKK